ncbi:glutathione S-transferase family protein [Roseibium sp.]|uniref:glutathione S-transferase family protein n=1 Tax=Roseibium sp. TaxID=1936156 RepID=UPI003BAE7D68
MTQIPAAVGPKLEENGALTRYRLHGSPDSANLVVRMMLEELGEAYDYVPVDRLTSQQKSPAYRKLNPQGLIPVLEVPGQDAPLFETGAILLFLSDRHAQLAPGAASPARGRFLKWLFYLSNTLHSDLRISFKVKRYLPDQSRHQLFSDTLIERIGAGFQFLEAELETGGGPCLLGKDVSCVDLYLAACVRWAQIYGNSGKWNLAGTPCLQKLMEFLEKRPALRLACQKEGIEGLPFTRPVPVTLPGVTG